MSLPSSDLSYQHIQYASKELAKRYKDGPELIIIFPSDRPHRQTIDELFDDPKAMAEFEEVRRAAAALPDGPMNLEKCDICQSSPFESRATKNATYIPSELREHQKQHHSDNSTFDTWLLHHHRHPDCYACTVCPKSHSSASELQLHLLEKHKDDVPTRLPESIYSLAFRLCMVSKDYTVIARASKYQKVVKDHAAAAVEKGKIMGNRGESSKSGGWRARLDAQKR